jgi:SNF2 family DNA or RNA helicase
MNPYLKSVPLKHQIETAAFILKTKFILDGSEMGTGKSLSALLAFDIMKSKDTFATMLVVCPPGLINNWKAEITKHTTFKSCSKFKSPDWGADIFILPYTQLKHGERLFKNASFVVSDEAHYLKNMDSQRSRHFHKWMKTYSPEYFDFATGTPLKNRVPESYSMLRLWEHGPNLPKVSDKYRSYYTFCDHFCHKTESSFGTSYSGIKKAHVEELKAYIHPFTIRHPASLLNLPELRESDIVCAYDDNPGLAMAFSRFEEEGIGAEITVKRDSAVATAKFTSDYVKECLEQNSGPVVVFSDHVVPLEEMQKELSEFRVGRITGSTPMQDRQPLVDRLNSGDLDVLLGTFGAMSSGYNMTGANLMVVNDPPWIPGDYEQAKKRILRLGQTRVCRVVRVIGSKVVEKIYDTLEDKMRTINKVMEIPNATK